MDETYNEGWFFVGEFWKDSLSDMSRYMERMGMLPLNSACNRILTFIREEVLPL
jgi:hypothetical protein